VEVVLSILSVPSRTFPSSLGLPEVVSSLPSWDVASQRSSFSPGMVSLYVQPFPVLHGWLLEDQEISGVLLSVLLLRAVCADALCGDPHICALTAPPENRSGCTALRVIVASAYAEE
jgi:hypothetical protein